MKEEILKKRATLMQKLQELSTQHQQLMNALKQQETQMIQLDGAIIALDDLLKETPEEIK